MPACRARAPASMPAAHVSPLTGWHACNLSPSHPFNVRLLICSSVIIFMPARVQRTYRWHLLADMEHTHTTAVEPTCRAARIASVPPLQRTRFIGPASVLQTHARRNHEHRDTCTAGANCIPSRARDMPAARCTPLPLLAGNGTRNICTHSLCRGDGLSSRPGYCTAAAGALPTRAVPLPPFRRAAHERALFSIRRTRIRAHAPATDARLPGARATLPQRGRLRPSCRAFPVRPIRAALLLARSVCAPRTDHLS